MEQLRAELSHLLGERLSRIECVNEKSDTTLWALYDSQGKPDAAHGAKFFYAGAGQTAGMENHHAGPERDCSHADYLRSYDA